MSTKRSFPPLWALPIILTRVPRMLWHGKRGNYRRSLKIGRSVMMSHWGKTQAFKGYVPTKHDVFVCTYSKSGTNWMMQMVTQLAWHGDVQFEKLHDLVPWPETPVPGAAVLNAPTWQGSPEQLRAVKTHAEAQYVPYSEQAKYIVVIRDPKDAMVSGFYFADTIMPGVSSMGIEAWSEVFVEGNTPYGSWSEHMASYWAWRDRPNVLLITYAEMKEDLETAVQKVATFLNVQLTEAQLETVVHKCSFAYMKAHADRFLPPSPTLNNDDSMVMIRKGKKGEASTLLSEERLAEIDQEYKRQLKTLGSDFPYDNYF